MSLLFASPALGAGYWECVLDRLPGTANDVVARRVAYDCKKEYPEEDYPPKKTGWFQPSVSDCIVKHGKTTSSPVAARLIGYACHRLYEDK